MPGKQLLQVADAATWESNVLRVVFGARDDARRERRRQSHLLPLVELRVLECREALDLIQERTREPRLLDEDTLGENRADFARQRLIDSGWSRSSGRRSLPGHLVFLLARGGDAQADDLASGACFPGDGRRRCCHVHGPRAAGAGRSGCRTHPGATCPGSGRVGCHRELVAAPHRFGDEVAAHPARSRGRHGRGEKEPDMRAVSRS